MEKIHQVFGSMLKTKYLVNATFEAVDPCSDILASIIYAVQCVYHSTLQATPRQLVFGRNMFLDITFQTNYKEIWLRKKKLINFNNKPENTKLFQYDYKFSLYVYILSDINYRKLEGDKLGLFRITQVNTNDSVRIKIEIINE